MRFKEIQGLSVDELKKKLQEKQAELFDTRMKNSMGQLGNPLEVRTNRRSIAKIKTALTQKLSQ